MAYGTINVDTLTASTGVLATQNGMTGIAKAWVNFTGASGGATINGSFNVSSITRYGLGAYTINLTTALPSVNYAVNISFARATGSGGQCQLSTFTTPTTSQFSVEFFNYNSASGVDNPYNYISVFGS